MNSFLGKEMLGNVGKHYGKLGKVLIFNNLFEEHYRFTCKEAEMLTVMDRRLHIIM